MDVSEKSYYASKGVAYMLVVGLAIGVGIPVIFAVSIFLFGDGRSPEGTLILLSFVSAGFMYWATSWRFKYMECAFSDIPVLETDEETVRVHGRPHPWSELVRLRSEMGYDLRHTKVCNMKFEFSDGHCPEASSKNLADADDMERAVRVAYYRYCEFHPEVTMADVAFKE